MLFFIDPQSGGETTGLGNMGMTNDVYVLDSAPAGFRPSSSFVVDGFQGGLTGDQIYLHSFLLAAAPGFHLPVGVVDPFLSGYLRLEQSGADTVIQFDPTGQGVWSDLVTLRGVDPYILTWFNFPDFSNGPNAQVVGTSSLPGVTGAAAVQQASPLGTLTGVSLTGGAGPDVLNGGRGNDTFHGGGGDDRIFSGGGGIDTATYDGPIRSYSMTAANGIVQISGGPEGGTDTLAFIARMKFADGYLATGSTDTAAQVYRLYWATLDRAPDQEGLTNWTNALNAGTSLDAVAAGFVNSPEFQSTYGALNNNDFVTLLYHNVLNRAPDAAGLNTWVIEMMDGMTRAQVVTGFSESPEDIAALAAPVQQGLWIGDAAAAQVARLYDTVLGRLPDASGLANWTHQIESGSSLQSVANGFVGSTEFQTTYGALNNNDFVTLLYHNVLHRDPDQAGLQNWINNLNGGETRAQVVVGFSESPEHISNTAAHIDSGIWLAS